MNRRRSAFTAAVTVGVVLAGWAGTAGAHASLASSDPADGAVLETAPTAIVLTFTEPVDPVEGSIRLLAGNGTPIDVGDADQSLGDATMRVAVPALDDGTYAVGWSAVSADSHPISGAFLFTVGAPSNNPGALLLAQARGATTDTGATGWLGIGRWFGYAGFALLIGVLALTAICAPTLLGSTRTAMLATIGAAAAAIGTVLMIAAQASAITDTGWSPGGWPDVIDTRSGRWWFARLIPLAVAPLAIRARTSFGDRRIASISGLAAAGTTFAIITAGGHAATGRWTAAGFVATVLHLTAMTVWIGALVVIVAVAPRPRLWQTASAVSPWALGSVVVLAGTGFVNGWRQLDGLDGLTDTSYGRWLVVKLVVVVVVVAGAAVSRSVLARHRRTAAATNDDGAAPSLTTIRRSAILEAVGMAVVLGATAGLVNTPPPVALANPAPVTVSASDVQGVRVAQIELAPARTGGTTLHVVINSPGGSLDKADEITVTASLPEEQLGPLEITVTPAGPNHVTTNAADFPLPGVWEIEVTARYGEFDQVIFTIEAEIR